MQERKIVAIHRGGAFPERWMQHATHLGWEAKLVNGHDAQLWSVLRGCDGFLWHLNQDDPLDLEYARSVLYAAELAGKRVFPNHATCWHFDDKIAQARLLEAIGAPLARTWIFCSQQEALDFLGKARYPLVFKLRRGAGSMNVRLVRDHAAGERLVRRMFGRGILSRPPAQVVSRTWARIRKPGPNPAPFRARLRRGFRRWLTLFLHPPRERGYALFQEFVAGNDHDLRVTIIGDRAFVYRRDVRPNDFRASGSGRLRHMGKDELPRDVIDAALEISRRQGFQSMAYDFVRDPGSGRPVLLEMSYVFVAQYIHDCHGYLEGGTTWREGHFWPQDAILDDLFR